MNHILRKFFLNANIYIYYFVKKVILIITNKTIGFTRQSLNLKTYSKGRIKIQQEKIIYIISLFKSVIELELFVHVRIKLYECHFNTSVIFIDFLIVH